MKLALIAKIIEADCIGCTKCIQACPVDAIVGSAKWMHTVITDDCIGCKLCLPPCPVDCIELIEQPPLPQPERLRRAQRSKQLHQAQKQRLEYITQQREKPSRESLEARKAEIAAALARVQSKKEGL